MKLTLDDAVSKFGATAKSKLSNPAVTGQPEDQLRAPLETLIADLCAVIGPAADGTVTVGETSLADLMTRPDYSVTRKGALIGHIEVKAPGKGADPRKFTDKHDKGQWEKLKALPNLIYTDGNAFSLWRDGVRAMEIVVLDGDVETSGTALKAPPILTVLLSTFLDWNAIKRKEAITVVIGNPPYKEKAKGLGGWVENRGPGLTTPLDDWQPPVEWGVGAHAKHLRNLYVYFWRWAAWKVFGGDPFRGGTDKTVVEDWTRRQGVVCFITVAGFLNGPGFQKMRADLRRDADEIWVIDCTPEGHQPPVASRIFEGVQQTVCIVMASRKRPDSPVGPARVRVRSLPDGTRAAKFAALAAIGLDDGGWVDAPSEPRAPFLPAAVASWGG